MSNRLAHETSPYLRQHAENPVDWYPWGEEAFARARREQKPIFLSIGYSTCHWCHVMAHECFEDAAIATLLNEHFVNIKVDREERPDVDKVYMTYVQARTGHGGWPLSAWLTPDLKPFFGGTYFPPEERHGRPGFPALLRTIARSWQGEREVLVAEADRVIGLLRERAGRPAAALGEEPLPAAAATAFERGFQYFYEQFDAQKGGFGGPPKFPRASGLHFLFRCAALQGLDSEPGREAVQMATFTLQKMAEGGLHDHVGGGFHRYSVDDEWFVPHFEKMLYDQAQIAVNYLDAYRATGREIHAWLARDIFDYVQRDLAHPAGGFYSAEDADSLLAAGRPEHAEGAFYVWTQPEVAAALGEGAAFFCEHFDVRAEGNVPAALDPQGELRGKNILRQRQPLAVTAQHHGLPLEAASDRLSEQLERLRAVRAQRPRPHRDDKIIAAWNGLMISALARGATTPADCLADRREFYRDAAVRAATFLRRELYDEARGVLYRAYRDGRGSTEGFAEDYALVIAGLLDLYEATFEIAWLQWAERLQETMDRRFADEAEGGYFNSPAEDGSLVLRLKEDYDGAEPSPNSVAAANLLRLASLREERAGSTEKSGPQRAFATLAAFRGQWQKSPQALPEMLVAVERAIEGSRQVVLAGDPARADFQALAAVVRERLGPHYTLLAADGGEGQAWLAARMPAIAEMAPRDGRAQAYVCAHATCQPPVDSPAALRALLRTEWPSHS